MMERFANYAKIFTPICARRWIIRKYAKMKNITKLKITFVFCVRVAKLIIAAVIA